jgi:hypothetical protein
VGIFEDLYRGVGEEAPTTDDNKPSYMLPIGRLSDSVRERLVEWRGDALALRSRAEDLARETRERFEDARDELKGQLSDLRKEVGKQAKKLRRRKD